MTKSAITLRLWICASLSVVGLGCSEGTQVPSSRAGGSTSPTGSGGGTGFAGGIGGSADSGGTQRSTTSGTSGTTSTGGTPSTGGTEQAGGGGGGPGFGGTSSTLAGGSAGSSAAVGGGGGTQANSAGGATSGRGTGGTVSTGGTGQAGAHGDAGGDGDTTIVGNLPDGPVALPDGAPGIEFDDIQWGPTLRRVIVPAGRSGKVDLIDPDTSEVTALSGLSATSTYKAGTRYGSTSATEVGNYIAALDQTTAKLYIFDPTKKVSVLSVTLKAAPDYVYYVKPTGQLYLTAPGAGIDVYSLSTSDPPTPTYLANITVSGGPESLAVDGKRNRAYTDGFSGSTYAIDLNSRAIVGTWKNGCTTSLGVKLDETRGYLFVACSEGKVVVLDVANGGAKLSELTSGSGLDVIAFNADLSHVYASSSTGKLAIMGVSSKGALSVLGTVATVANAKGVAADDRNHAWVCDPDHGQVLRITDTFPKTD